MRWMLKKAVEASQISAPYAKIVESDDILVDLEVGFKAGAEKRASLLFIERYSIATLVPTYRE